MRRHGLPTRPPRNAAARRGVFLCDESRAPADLAWLRVAHPDAVLQAPRARRAAAQGSAHARMLRAGGRAGRVWTHVYWE